MKRRVWLACSLLSLGCTSPSPYMSLMEESKDAALIDASTPEDLGQDSTLDSGGDAQTPDAQTPDAQTPDAAVPEVPDVQVPDAQTPDAQISDVGVPDAETPDAQAAPADIWVELTWHTPHDPNELDDQGTDMDLHLRHPNAHRWRSSPWDCYSTNPNPDWGVQVDLTDDPALLTDDQDGAGPEVLILNHAEVGASYQIGVHYYRARVGDGLGTWGASDVTVRIYLRGELAWTNDTSKTLVQDDDFWTVAQIVWVGDVPTVSVIDRVWRFGVDQEP